MIRFATSIAAGLWLLLVMAAPGWCVEEGETMPEFTVQTLDGDSVSRTSLSGKPVLLVFWNTWCPDCRRELPAIDKLAETYGPRGLTVLAINTAINDSETKTRNYWQKQGFRFPTGFDHAFEIGQAFGVRGVPTILLIDAKGVVRYKRSRPPEDPGVMEELFTRLSGGE